MKITEKINETYKLVDNVKERIGELSKELDQLNNFQQSTFLEYFQSLGLRFDETEIKDFFKQALEESKLKKYLKGTLALILQKRRATSYEEIRKSLGLSSTGDIGKACSTLEKYEIIKKTKDNGILKVDFNIEGVNEIVELSNQRKKSEKLINELFKD